MLMLKLVQGHWSTSALSGDAKRSEELSNANTLPMSVTFVVQSDVEDSFRWRIQFVHTRLLTPSVLKKVLELSKRK